MKTFEQWSLDNQDKLEKLWSIYLSEMEDSVEHKRYVANSDKCREEWERMIFDEELKYEQA